VQRVEADFRGHYSRSDARGGCPRVSGGVGAEFSRLGVFWRPLVDMGDSGVAAQRLRMIAPVSRWIGQRAAGRVSWFSRIAVPGLRRQVVRHAGLGEYDCGRPEDLAAGLRSDRWDRLAGALGEFGGLDDWTRALVVFQLAQLSFCHYAVAVTGLVAPSGEPGRDQLAYMVARVHARIPGMGDRALPVFEALATTTPDPHLAMLAAAQGAGLGIRDMSDVGLARRFEKIGRDIKALPDDWQGRLVRSRFHRAVALLRVAMGRPDEMRAELEEAWRLHEALAAAAPPDEPAAMVVAENRRIIVESEIKACFRPGVTSVAPTLVAWARELSEIDPHCPQALLTAGDGYRVAGQLEQAARCYAGAGELGTTAGATGWYRAAQCRDHLGDYSAALNAMGRCLELDTTAVEPKQYMATKGRMATKEYGATK
jgi:tetratricopeptide (TPR) repeat protein